MNNNLYYIFLVFILVLLQALVLNNILLFGYITPYLYIALIFYFPFKTNRFPILSIAFILGLFFDSLFNSGGAHAFSTLFIAFLRPTIFRFAFQKTESDYEYFDLNQETFGNFFNYIVILTFLHHFILFSLINFSFNNFSKVIVNTLLSGVFTLLLFFIGHFIFRKKHS